MSWDLTLPELPFHIASVHKAGYEVYSDSSGWLLSASSSSPVSLLQHNNNTDTDTDDTDNFVIVSSGVYKCKIHI